MKREAAVMIIYGAIGLLGCGRTVMNKPVHVQYSPGSDTAVIPNDVASINSFVISAVNNPGVLKRDVVASIAFEKIRLVFDSGTNLSNLTPTIGFSGKSLSPATLTPENFDSTLLYNLTASDGTVYPYRIEVAFQ
jgi:hypothetical protein